MIRLKNQRKQRVKFLKIHYFGRLLKNNSLSLFRSTTKMKKSKLIFVSFLILLFCSSFGIVDTKSIAFSEKITLVDSTNNSQKTISISKEDFIEKNSTKKDLSKSNQENFNLIEKLTVILMKTIKFIIMKVAAIFI
ncbi:MAG: hypothetical protein RIR51_1349 [Bacteroidota bacterium]